MFVKFFKYVLWVVGLALVLLMAYTYYQRTVPQQKAQAYSELLTEINTNPESISEVEVGPSTATIKLVGDMPSRTVQIPQGAGGDLIKALIAHKVKVYADNSSANAGASMTLVYWVIPLIMVVIFVMFIARQLQSGGSQALSFGRSRAKLLTENRPKVTFADVAGVDEAKEELGEVVDFLKNPKKFQALGARIPKGVLAARVRRARGKTLLARAVAGEAGVPFFCISGSDFVEMFVGVGASRVRDLFEQAKKSAPCIVFIDEIDAVGRQRGAGLGGGHDEREQTLNQMLVEMDGFEPNTGVIVIAATNRPDVLDPALLRPGRFDRQIVGGPRRRQAAARQILEVHAQDKPLAPNESAGDRSPPHARLLRRGSRESAQRSRAARGALEQDDDRDARLRRGHRPRHRRAGAQDAHHVAAREGDRGLPRVRPRARRRSSCPTRTRCTRSRSSRAAWRSASPCSCPTEDRYLMTKAN